MTFGMSNLYKNKSKSDCETTLY